MNKKVLLYGLLTTGPTFYPPPLLSSSPLLLLNAGISDIHFHPPTPNPKPQPYFSFLKNKMELFPIKYFKQSSDQMWHVVVRFPERQVILRGRRRSLHWLRVRKILRAMQAQVVCAVKEHAAGVPILIPSTQLDSSLAPAPCR